MSPQSYEYSVLFIVFSTPSLSQMGPVVFQKRQEQKLDREPASHLQV